MSFKTNTTTQTNAKSLRQNMTEAERKLWQRLRGSQLGVKFRRQVPIGGYVVDFFTHSNNLAIELDGSHHLQPEQLAYDNIRTEYLNSLGITVIRYDNHSVLTQIDAVIADIVERLENYYSTKNYLTGANQ
ncbi:endonuclease domain-containing protein [Psychrobacter sp. I-STPA10]|uniref:endonuclease domain-containing protein n=1 Tax=Psychrobacter sp. I-STPA10 TaxID=2585769 RepID=UPI001E369F3D|nr:DUF559 domain-containing protein [Psychrobacter sp. I-STPA10]